MPSVAGKYVIISLVLMMLSCVKVKSPAESGGELFYCTTSSQCYLGTICANGFCMAKTISNMVLDFKVIPPNNSDYLEQEFLNLDLGEIDSPVMPALQFIKPVVISGKVTRQTGPGGIYARIEFKNSRKIGNSIATYRGDIFPEALSGESRYRVALLPGTYRATITLTGSGYPPIQFKDVSVYSDKLQDFVLPSTTSLNYVRGLVYKTEEQGAFGAVEGARVYAYTEELPIASTEDVTDQRGRFEIVLPPGDNTYTFRVSPGASGVAIPTAEYSQRISGDEDVAPFYLGEFDQTNKVKLTGFVSGIDSAGLAVFIPGATLAFSSVIRNGKFIASSLTGEVGNYEVDLLPGSYDLIITPTIISSFALKHETFTINVSGRRDVTLELKTMLTGRVRSQENGALLSGIRVRAFRVQGLNSESATGLRYGMENITDADGRFLLNLDPGIYDISYIPTMESGRHRWTESNVPVSGRLKELSHDFTATSEITGVIYNAQGQPFPGVSVEVYLNAPPENTTSRPVGFSRTLTDSYGRYRVMLPGN